MNADGGWWQPTWARRVNRAAEQPAEPLEMRILNKRKRFLRAAGLKEIEGMAVCQVACIYIK